MFYDYINSLFLGLFFSSSVFHRARPFLAVYDILSPTTKEFPNGNYQRLIFLSLGSHSLGQISLTTHLPMSCLSVVIIISKQNTLALVFVDSHESWVTWALSLQSLLVKTLYFHRGQKPHLRGAFPTQFKLIGNTLELNSMKFHNIPVSSSLIKGYPN